MAAGNLDSDDRAMLEAVAAEPMLAQAIRWAEVNSGSRNLAGLAEMASLLADAFAPLPGDITLCESAPVETVGADGGPVDVSHGCNLRLVVRPDAPVQLLLTGHMDTVFGADHPFQKVTQLEAGILGGPGLADMKGGIALMLAALKGFERSADAHRLGYEVIINADEEVGSPGSAPLIAAAARGKHAALTYEPAILPDGTLASSRPGSGNFAIVVTGRSAHAGRNPEDGRNALLAAADLALALAAFRRPGLSVNPARIDGGSPNNVVPAHAILHVNLRPLTPADEQDARMGIDAAIADVARRHDVSIHLHGGFGRPPKPVTAETERLYGVVRDCGAALGLNIGWRPSGGVCDGNNIAACGVPVIDTMGARGGAIHSPDEYLVTDSLAERAMLSALVLRRLAWGDFR